MGKSMDPGSSAMINAAMAPAQYTMPFTTRTTPMYLVTSASFFLLLMSASVSSIISFCDVGYCFVGPDGCVASGPGVVCAECTGVRGTGWLDSGVCVYESFEFSSLREYRPSWVECGLYKCVERGDCVTSEFGAMCDECSNRGFVINSPKTYEPTCMCYDVKDDGDASCQSLFEQKRENVSVTDSYENIACIPHRNKVMGYYVGEGSLSKYGSVAPFVPNQCIKPYGPSPGQRFEILPPYDTCATIVAPDPDALYGPEADASEKTCSYHGSWNRTIEACVCDDRWTLTPRGEKDIYGRPAYTCGGCASGLGPPPPEYDAGSPQKPPYCVGPYVENEFGVRRVCSGHGVFKYDVCVCYQSVSLGFWDLIEIDGVFTCMKCKLNYGPPGKCTVRDGTTETPTALTNSPTLAPTEMPARNSTCESCPERAISAVSLNPLHERSVALFPIDFRSVCCAHDPPTYLDESLVSFSTRSECVANETERIKLAAELCDLVDNCVATWWVQNENGYSFTILNGSDFGYSANENAGTLLACPISQSPTRKPTAYPTTYPTMR